MRLICKINIQRAVNEEICKNKRSNYLSIKAINNYGGKRL